jgi:DNA-binding beta-propeller fold protein YncE
VTSSNRFEGSSSKNQDITVVDATRLAAGSGAVLGAIPAGAFPRQIHVTADGQTLLLTNFTSGSLEIIDVRRLDSVIKRVH